MTVLSAIGRLASTPMTLRHVSTLFLDLRNFGRFSSAHKPEAIADVLNLLWEGLGPIIWRYDGVIDKFMGDAILVTFNTETDQPDHARRAVATAVDALRWVRDDFTWQGLRFRARAGVSTGEVAFGPVGTAERKDVTVIGSQVNVAAVLQGRAGADHVVTDAETFRQLAASYVGEELGYVDVFGQQVQAYLVSP